MTDVDVLKANLGLPPIGQIGVVVRDVEKTAQYYSAFLGIGPFTIHEFRPEDDLYNGEKMKGTRLKFGKAMWNNVEWELIQPMEGRSPHMDWLQRCGEGVQHLGFIVPKFDEVCERFRRAGFKPILLKGSYPEPPERTSKACYFDTDKVIGIVFEVIWRSWLPECQAK